MSALEDSSSERLNERGSSVGGESEAIGAVPSASGGDGDDGGSDGGGSGPTTYDASVSVMTGTATNDSAGNKWIAQVTITVVDAGVVINGVTVTGSWDISGSPSGTTTSCQTNASGQCVVQRPSINDSNTTVTFTISSVSSGDPNILVNYAPATPDSHTVDCTIFVGACS